MTENHPKMDSKSRPEGNAVKCIKTEIIQHRGQEQIALRFSYDLQIVEHLKKLPDIRWSQTHRCFYILRSPDNLKRLLNHCRNVVWVDITPLKNSYPGKMLSIRALQIRRPRVQTAFEKLPLSIQDAIHVFQVWMEQHRYSPQTVKNYTNHLSQFFLFCDTVAFTELTVADVIRFNHEVILRRRLSISYQRLIIEAIKLFYGRLVGHTMEIDRLDRPFKEQKLPVVLSKSEVERIILATGNIKHKTMLSLLYSCGLRRGEVLALKKTDLDIGRNLIRIVQAKGLPRKIKKVCREILLCICAF